MKEKMLAAVLHKPLDLRVENIDVPQIGSDDVLIRVKMCGICGTDPHIFKGRFPAPFPLVLGHEFAGEVAAVGSNVTNLRIGERVTADINMSCGSCYFCVMGQKLFCNDVRQIGVHVDGAFAEYVKAPACNVFKLDDMSWQNGAYVEPLACVINGQERAGIQLGSTVAIIGAGPMGLSHALISKYNGASRVIISEMNKERLQKAREIGVDFVIDAGEEDVAEAVMDLTNGRGADVVIEVVGSPATYTQAFAMVRKGGTLVAYGAAPANAEISVKPFEIYSKELTIVGSYAGSYEKWLKAVNMIEGKRFDPGLIVTKTIPLTDVVAGIMEAEENKSTVKIMVEI